MDQKIAEIVSFYTGYDEAGRLDRRPSFQLERIRTMELLEQHLPPAPASILDVGGGPGAYARPLLAAGYQVRLVDLVPAHVEQARAGQPPIDAVVGDARELPAPDHAHDATLLLGPLYHLQHRDDRVRALREAVRVTRPGGVVVAAAISRFAGPVDFAVTGRLTPAIVEETRQILTDGINLPGLGFTHAYFHRVADLIAECREAGLTGIVVHGVEGPAWAAAEAAAGTPDGQVVFDGALKLARVCGADSEIVAASAHLLVTATTGQSGR
ncbi:class I SAM-dependent methyltransferase [Actinoplanes sp. NEAU-A12]|uniref:Class I SAM-dependent methyltransferase n=1 Tax=Actinoplanes sandaracinus TaxID=3045177 RepID=A0ABT6WK08_9ACTN|nr:class I SAM-dependent methyltransferase [Actinoplanes sandaracinus]MDI6100059.1 class I SAM-dependent methyltransferase [Actinoplanes sandaracinus]